MPKQTVVGALVVVYHKGPTSTYRWIDKWTYDNIVVRGLETAEEQVARAKKLLPRIEAAARSMTEQEFRRAFNSSPSEALLQLQNPVGVSTMTLRTIEVESVFKGNYLGHGATLQINFKDVKRVRFNETQRVDEFGP